jgi:hypothetical protein
MFQSNVAKLTETGSVLSFVYTVRYEEWLLRGFINVLLDTDTQMNTMRVSSYRLEA